MMMINSDSKKRNKIRGNILILCSVKRKKSIVKSGERNLTRKKHIHYFHNKNWVIKRYNCREKNNTYERHMMNNYHRNINCHLTWPNVWLIYWFLLVSNKRLWKKHIYIEYDELAVVLEISITPIKVICKKKYDGQIII